MNTMQLLKQVWEVLSKPNKKLDNVLIKLLIVTFLMWFIARSLF